MGAFDQLYEGGSQRRSRPPRRPAQRRGAGPLRRPLHRAAAAANLRPRHRRRPRASLRDYAEGINASPERLAEIEDRLALSRPPQAQVRPDRRRGRRLRRRRSPQAGRSRRPRRNPQNASARRSSPPPPRPIAPPPSALTAERKAAAAKLAKLAEAQINSLAMKVKFEVAVHSAEDIGQRWQNQSAEGRL
jgi:DNA repair protein RecN (Recombination protein N)